MTDLPITWVEVFATEKPLSGQLLGVVHDADDVASEDMQTLARRLRQPETSFIQEDADAEEASYRHRIFTIGAEIPFAGHPSLGTAAARAARDGKTSANYVQETGAGLQELIVELEGDEGRVEMAQNPHEYGPSPDAAPILAALGIDPDQAHAELDAQVVSTGLPALILPLRSPEPLAAAAIDASALRAALPESGGAIAINCYVVAEREAGHWQARMFTPDVAGGEDPATGSAVGPFGAYLNDRTGETQFIVDQGTEMGFPSRLEVEIRDGIRVAGRCRISGTGVQAMPS